MSKPYKPIICLDFDGVVHSYTSGWKGPRHIPDPPVDGALEFMHEMLNHGWDVVICSSRGRYIGGNWAMRRWLYLHSRDSGYWYEDPFGPGLEDVRFVSRKPPAILTLDDRAQQFQGIWPKLSEVKAFKPWKAQE
jgi:hypothetical protein